MIAHLLTQDYSQEPIIVNFQSSFLYFCMLSVTLPQTTSSNKNLVPCKTFTVVCWDKLRNFSAIIMMCYKTKASEQKRHCAGSKQFII